MAIDNRIEYARGFAEGLGCALSAARVTLDELANEDFPTEEERDLARRVAASVLRGIEVAVRAIRDLEDSTT